MTTAFFLITVKQVLNTYLEFQQQFHFKFFQKAKAITTYVKLD